MGRGNPFELHGESIGYGRRATQGQELLGEVIDWAPDDEGAPRFLEVTRRRPFKDSINTGPMATNTMRLYSRTVEQAEGFPWDIKTEIEETVWSGDFEVLQGAVLEDGRHSSSQFARRSRVSRGKKIRGRHRNNGGLTDSCDDLFDRRE